MKTNTFAVKVSMILSFCLIAVSMMLNEPTIAEDANQNSANKQSQPEITPIDSKYVCMINNQSFNKEQIPVEIEGKTYYGCCQMCEGKLKSDPGNRIAIDPVSDNEVDKATAIIGAAPDGTVYYFENEENLKAFKGNTNSTD